MSKLRHAKTQINQFITDSKLKQALAREHLRGRSRGEADVDGDGVVAPGHEEVAAAVHEVLLVLWRLEPHAQRLGPGDHVGNFLPVDVLQIERPMALRGNGMVALDDLALLLAEMTLLQVDLHLEGGLVDHVPGVHDHGGLEVVAVDDGHV